MATDRSRARADAEVRAGVCHLWRRPRHAAPMRLSAGRRGAADALRQDHRRPQAHQELHQSRAGLAADRRRDDRRSAAICSRRCSRVMCGGSTTRRVRASAAASWIWCLTSMIPWIAEKPWEFAYDTGRRRFLATEEIHFVRNVLTNVPADPIDRRRRAAAHSRGLGAAGRLRPLVDRAGSRGDPARLRAAHRGRPGRRRRAAARDAGRHSRLSLDRQLQHRALHRPRRVRRGAEAKAVWSSRTRAADEFRSASARCARSSASAGSAWCS